MKRENHIVERGTDTTRRTISHSVKRGEKQLGRSLRGHSRRKELGMLAGKEGVIGYSKVYPNGKWHLEKKGCLHTQDAGLRSR